MKADHLEITAAGLAYLAQYKLLLLNPATKLAGPRPRRSQAALNSHPCASRVSGC